MRTLGAELLVMVLLTTAPLLGVGWQPVPMGGGQPPKDPVPPPTQKVLGLELVLDKGEGQQPESQPLYQIDPEEKFINLVAKAAPWPPADKPVLKRVRWVVLSTGKVQPKVRENMNQENTTISVGLPNLGESLFISACAMVELGSAGKNDVTDHASVIVITGNRSGDNGGNGSNPPTPLSQGTPGQATKIPPGIRGLSVIVVCQTKTAEYAALEESPLIKSTLAEAGSTLYVLDAAAAQRRPRDVLPFVQQTGLPCLLVVSQDGRRLLPAGNAQRLNVLPFDGKNNQETARRNVLILLDMVGHAAGGR